MSMDVSSTSGDGITAPFIDADVLLPDSGTSIAVGGSVQAVGGVLTAITGSPVTSPGVPASGTNWWIIQVHTTTGVATVKASTTGMPTPDAGNVVVFQQTLPAGANTDPMLQGGTATPDTW